MRRYCSVMHSDALLGLSGRVAIVTGAASGYGRACAEALAKLGVRVVLCDINEASLRVVAGGLPQAAEHLVAVRDISRVAECEQLVEAIYDSSAAGRAVVLTDAQPPRRNQRGAGGR